MLLSCLLIVLHKCSQPNNTMTVFHAFLFFFFFKHSNPRCSPWLESDTTVAVSLVSLYTRLIANLHDKFKGKDVMVNLITYQADVIFEIRIQSSSGSDLLLIFDQIACCQDKKMSCGFISCTTARAAPLQKCQNIFCIIITPSTASCLGKIFIQTKHS